MKRNLILFIHAGHPIETEAAKLSRLDWARFGYELEEFSVKQADATGKLKRILRERAERIAFFYSMNFWALNIRQGDALLHRITGIPLVIMMHDHPVYFLSQVSPALDGTLIFAPGEELADFIAKHYEADVRAIGDAGYRPYAEGSGPMPSLEDFLARKNALLCPMNLSIFGENIDDVWSGIKSLPEARRKRAVRLIDATLADCLTPLHVISERLTADGDPELAIEDLRWVMNYVKLWRRHRIVEALIELPVLVSTAYVPAELERRHPEKFTLFTRPQTRPLYRTYRFVLNSNPLIHCFHERVTEALVNNAVCVTDPNIPIVRHFEDGRDMLFVDYARDDLPERVAALLDDPERAFAMTLSSYRVRSAPSFTDDAHRRLLAAVDDRWATRTPPR